MVQQQRVRLAVMGWLGVGAVLAATLTVPSGSGLDDPGPRDAADAVSTAYQRQVDARQARRQRGEVRSRQQAQFGGAADFVGAVSGDDGNGHSDLAGPREDLISRSAEATSPQAADPTTKKEAEASRSVAAAQRSEPSPRVRSTVLQAPRYELPRTRYEMAGACYGVRAATTSRWLTRTADDQVRATGRTEASAARLRFRATDLGSFLLYGERSDFLEGTGPDVRWAAEPSPSADWTVRRPARNRFTFTVPDGYLSADPDGTLRLSPTSQGAASRWRLERISGCEPYPEVEVNATGRPYKGVSGFQQTYGLTDPHTHGMAFRFLGGALHCGKPWDRYGAPYALRDCQDHEVADGKGAVVEDFLSGRTPGTGHDPVGWPTFKDWPAPESLTHEGTYYRWMERAWRGGLRVFTNLLVENNKLCQLYPLKSRRVLTQNPTCDDMTSLKWQADDMRAFQRYVDAQYGGPGRGWYRIVTDPFQARRVINSGRLAVIMGIETSVPFRCSVKPGVDGPQPDPGCTATSVNGWLDTVQRWGVRQMELVNKFDNAFSGIAGDAGATGALVNTANLAETGSAWRMGRCAPELTGGDPEVSDKPQLQAPPSDGPFPAEQQDALFGAVAQVAGVLPIAAPLYPPAPHCNRYGLSPLGDHVVRQMARRGMLFDPDHMSVKARQSALDLVEGLGYSGLLSTHSWSTPDAYPRILDLGGFIAPYAGDSAGFVQKWKRLQTWTDPRYFFGVGYGADINGLGAQGDPRNPGETNDVDYPFTGLGGVKFSRQRSGQRVYDINKDGVSHYGLYPDWVQDLKVQAGQPIVDDMARGAEAYLQTWERAVGITNDACRQPALRKRSSFFGGLARGLTVRQVLERAGQPNRRLGRQFTYCAKRDGRTVRMTVDFTSAGTLVRVRG